MSRKIKEIPQEETPRTTLRGLFDKALSILESEIDRLPETLEVTSPEKRLDFISKTLPLLLKYKESGMGDTWGLDWGE